MAVLSVPGSEALVPPMSPVAAPGYLEPVYLGIDFGTSGARAAVLDTQAQVQSLTHLVWSNGSAAELASTWQRGLQALIRQVPAELRHRVTRIAIAGTSATGLLCDAQGQLLLPPLLYDDSRAAEILDQLRPWVPAQHSVLAATSSLAKLVWCSLRVPTFSQATYWLHQADWLGFLLHGQLGHSDYHNCLKLGYDPKLAAYPDWFEQPALAQLRPLLPQVQVPGTVVAPILPSVAAQLGLPATCQICAGTTDSIAAFLASGAQKPGEAVTSLGSTLVLKLLSPTQVDSLKFGVYSHRLGSLWLVGGASNAGGAVLRHYFTDVELQDLSAQIDLTQPSPYDYYPLLKPGERFPINDPNLLPRLTPRPAEPALFLQGLLTGLTRIEAQGYQCLAELGAPALTQVYTAGGGAQNLTWAAMRQQQLQVPIKIAAQTEAAVGAAILALRAGHF
jgi:D-ribulokinase